MSLAGSAQPMPGQEAVAYCADIGGSYIKFGRASGPGTVSVDEEVATPVRSFDAFRDALAGLVARHPGAPEVAPLAISTAGLFDAALGTVEAANIPCLAGHDLVRELSASLGRPVLVANDADSFALAEASVGVGRGHDVVFAIILGTGVGGGLVIGGRPVNGKGGVSGEWGHGAILRTRLDLGAAGTVDVPRFACGCGREGCVDTVGGARGLERLHGHLTGERRTSHAILDGWEAGDPAFSATVAAYLELLAEPLAFSVNVVGPSIVPVGGGLASRGRLIEALDRSVRARTLHAYSAPLVVPGRFLKDGGLVGVSVLACRR